MELLIWWQALQAWIVCGRRSTQSLGGWVLLVPWRVSIAGMIWRHLRSVMEEEYVLMTFQTLGISHFPIEKLFAKRFENKPWPISNDGLARLAPTPACLRSRRDGAHCYLVWFEFSLVKRESCKCRRALSPLARGSCHCLCGRRSIQSLQKGLRPTHLTPLTSHHSSHTTHLTPLISHNISHTHPSHTTHLNPFTFHHSSLTTHLSPLASHHHFTPLISFISHHSSHIISHNISHTRLSHTTHLTQHLTYTLISHHSSQSTHLSPPISHHSSLTIHLSPPSHTTHFFHLTSLISHRSSHTLLISHHSSHTRQIWHHSSHTTHLTPLSALYASHTTHPTPLIANHSSHITHLTSLISHSHRSSHTYHWKTQNFTCGVIWSFCFWKCQQRLSFSEVS